MSILLAALKGEQKPGLYQLEQDITIEELSQLCQANSCQLFHIDGQTITNKAEFLQACIKALNLPDYFGNNWDAFEDCITDLEWCSANRYIVWYTHPEHFAENDPQQWAIAIDILDSAVNYWAETNTQMYVLFKSDNPLLKLGKISN